MENLETNLAENGENPAQAAPTEAAVAWEEFLEDDADCCGGYDHKVR